MLGYSQFLLPRLRAKGLLGDPKNWQASCMSTKLVPHNYVRGVLWVPGGVFLQLAASGEGVSC